MKNTERIVWIMVLSFVIVWTMTRNNKPTLGITEEKKTYSERRLSERASPHASGERSERRSGGTRVTELAIGAQTQRALRNPDPITRMENLLRVLSSCDAANLDQALASWKELKASGIQLPAEEALLDIRAGQLKGSELLAACTGSREDWSQMESRKNQFRGWLQADPSEAARWLDQLPAGKFRDQMTMIEVTSIAKDDPQRALLGLAALPDHLHRQAGQEMAFRLRETESVEASAAILKSMETHATEREAAGLDAMFNSLVDAASDTGSDQIPALLEEHLGQPYIAPNTWAQASTAQGKTRDATTALDWALMAESNNRQLPQGTLLASAVREMPLEKLREVESWSEKNFDKPGVTLMQDELARRIRTLEDRGDDANEYDPKD